MEMYLADLDLWDIVETLPADQSTAEFKKANRKAMCKISLAVDDTQMVHIMTKKTAKDMWDELKKVHQTNSLTNIIYLLRKFYSMRFDESGDCRQHVNSMMELREELRSRGETINDKNFVAVLLCSLPDSFSTLITAIEGRSEEDISLQYVVGKLLDECKRRKESSDSSNEALKSFPRNRNDKKKPRCHHCQKFGHFKSMCPLLMNKKKDSARKSEEKSTRGNDEKWYCLMSEHLSYKATKKSENVWILDSGASAHMTYNRDFFDELDTTRKSKIFVADGKPVKAEGIGSGFVSFTVAGVSKKVYLKNVLYAPGLDSNLLSIKRVTEAGCEVLFKGNRCTVKKDEDIIFEAVRNNLYELHNCKKATKDFVQEKDLKIWHRRLGHRNCEDVMKLQEMNLIPKTNSVPVGWKCGNCVKAKSTQLPFPKESKNRSKEVLDLIHSDVCGPVEVESVGGKRYFLTFIDDYSRYSYTYLLKKKSEVFQKFQEYLEEVENFFRRRPK